MEAKKGSKKQKVVKKEDDGNKYFQWNPEMDSSLADILRSERQSGRKGDGGWKTEAFTSAALKLSSIYNVNVTKDNVQNHLKGWKKTYAAVADILSQSGFSWDSGRKMIIVDDDNVWNEYAKAHTAASKYRFKTIANWDDIVDLCAKDRAHGYGAENAEEASAAMSIEEDNASMGDTGDTGGTFQDDSLKRKSVSSTSAATPHPKKVKVEETIAMAVSEMASSIKQMASNMVSSKANVTVDEVYEEMMSIPNLEDDFRWRAIEVFANNATKFKILKKIPLEKKSDFVLKSVP